LNETITAVHGIKVGHAHYEEALTGCTVVVLEKDCIVGVDVRGGNPGDYNVSCLEGTTTVESVDAIFFSGGSWFGLDVAKGVRLYLVERGIGWDTGFGIMPCVTGAIIYDLAVAKFGIQPDAKLGYTATAKATDNPVTEGSVGAGIGATVGKLLGMDRCMKGGIGTSSVTLDNGLCVGALVVVNSMGNVFDPNTGETIAGTRKKNGKGFIEATDLPSTLRFGLGQVEKNTTLGIVATNARLSQKQATKMAEMAQDGIARSICPAHTTMDGDIIYAVATGKFGEKFHFDYLAHMASDQIAKAIVRAVRNAKGVDSIPGLEDVSNEEH
jgi:L-aminopeptidase/D-esterase-like protein